MAQAQTASGGRTRSQKKPSARSRGSSSKSTKRTASKPKASNAKRTASKPKASKPKRSASKPKASKPKRSGSNSSGSSSKPSPVSVVENTAKDAGKTAKEAGKTVGRAASKAKVPLLAGGAALAGAAGGIALGAHQARRHKGLAKGIGKKVKTDDLAKAAKRVGSFGAEMGHFAHELQLVREDSNGHSRSPIEVVLEGLTARRSHHEAPLLPPGPIGRKQGVGSGDEEILRGPARRAGGVARRPGTGSACGRGHTVQLQLLGRDGPYYQPGNVPFAVRAAEVRVSLPTAQRKPR